MKRTVGLAVGAYLAVALLGLMRERMGLIACGCAADCWCHKPGLSLFRWVFPRGHKSAWTSGPKPLDDRDVGAHPSRQPMPDMPGCLHADCDPGAGGTMEEWAKGIELPRCADRASARQVHADIRSSRGGDDPPREPLEITDSYSGLVGRQVHVREHDNNEPPLGRRGSVGPSDPLRHSRPPLNAWCALVGEDDGDSFCTRTLNRLQHRVGLASRTPSADVGSSRIRTRAPKCMARDQRLSLTTTWITISWLVMLIRRIPSANTSLSGTMTAVEASKRRSAPNP